MRSIFALSLLLTGLPADAYAQAWRELYDRGQYAKAAELLHPLVLDSIQSADTNFPDPEPAEVLARMYFDGKGVTEDRILACSLAQLASIGASLRDEDPRSATTARTGRFRDGLCDSLAPDDRKQANEMVGCPQFGSEQQLIAVDARRVIEVSRRGIALRHAGAEHVEPLPAAPGCSHRIAMVRHTALQGRGAAAAERHLIEVFAWAAGGVGPARRLELHWQLGEILDDSIQWHTMELLGDQPGVPWVKTPVPAELASVRLQMRPNGEVRWRFKDGHPAGEIEPLPEREPSEPAPVLPTTGTARVDVTVLDRHGAPLEAATVRLTGVLSREAKADAAGTVTFENLPDGRYDVVAAAAGLAASVPRVLDLSGPAPRSVEVRLKPYAPTAMMTLACGGFDARSAAALTRGALLVVHGKVVDQRTVEGTPHDDGRVTLLTHTDMRVVRVFKSPAIGPQTDSALTILQRGGRLERADYVDEHTFNRLGPLSVGDEYVLFLTLDSKGAFQVNGSEEGAFRIRNGRVEPLGGARAAETWKNRSAVSFFQTLERYAGR